MKNTLLSVLYFLVFIMFMMSGRFESWVPGFILKALIIPVLILMLLLNVRLAGDRLNKLMFAGLVFSWIGDILLELPGEAGDFFIPGLLGFMLAQAMYLTAFFITEGPGIIRKKPLLVAPAIIYGGVLVYFLSPALGALKVPVFIYAAVILTMLCGALNRYWKVTMLSYWLVLAGAVLFVLSDSAIAVTKFLHPFKGSSWFIMTTYVLAQYLIITGYLRGRTD